MWKSRNRARGPARGQRASSHRLARGHPGGPHPRAHASLIGQSPADGAVLSSAPPEATLTFNEPVRVLLLSQAGPAGFFLSYRVLSAASHLIAGSVAFSLG